MMLDDIHVDSMIDMIHLISFKRLVCLLCQNVLMHVYVLPLKKMLQFLTPSTQENFRENHGKQALWPCVYGGIDGDQVPWSSRSNSGSL